MKDLDEKISSLKKFYYTENSKKTVLEKSKKTKEDRVKALREEVDTLDKVGILFQKTSKYARNYGKTLIEDFTTNSLRYIFDRDYNFEIELTERRNVSNADFYVVEEIENQTIKSKPDISRGGGIVDIVSLALRLAFLENTLPKLEGPLILDEPAKHVSEDYINDIGLFLLNFSKQRKRQIIMVTHNPHLASLSERIYRISQSDGVSQVESSNN